LIEPVNPQLQDYDLTHLRHYYDGEISEIGKKALTMMSILYRGLHNAPVNQLEKIDWGNTYYISLKTFLPLATYDNDALTTLVLLAHDYAVRVEVKPCNFHYLEIQFHQRKRDGDLYSRHPTIEKVLEDWRQVN
jgi:hypothetical protein